jgi:hypothetical protein
LDPAVLSTVLQCLQVFNQQHQAAAPAPAPRLSHARRNVMSAGSPLGTSVGRVFPEDSVAIRAAASRIGRKTDFVARKLPNERNMRGVTIARRLVNFAAGIHPGKRWRHGVGACDGAINAKDAERIIDVFFKYFPQYMSGDYLDSTPIPESEASTLRCDVVRFCSVELD